MESEHKDYAFKNEISLSIGDEESNASTPSTVTPQEAPRALSDDTKLLSKIDSEMMKPEGIDNKAFEVSEKPPLSSFGNGHSNGQLNETANGANKNGQLNEKKLAEAVNLELININSNNNMKKSSNGKNNNNDLPMKKDGGDVEMGHKKDESYDEYFVPVNEHRKYMSIKTRKLHGVDSNTGLSLVSPEYGVINYNRWINTTSRGEKLYVTKDKRAEKRKGKLCWILCIGIVAAVIILGILAASGTFSKSETPVEARQFGDKANHTVVGAGFGGIPSETTTTTAQSTTTTFTESQTIPQILSDEVTPPSIPIHDDEHEIAYVPNSLEGQITLSNAEYSSEYNDANSPIYKKLIKDLENEIKNALSSTGGNDEFFVKIIGLKSGSVVVDYRVSWKVKDENLTADEMKERIQVFLNRHNHQFMSRYTVNENTIRVARVPDLCSTSSKNNCDESCAFSADKVDFECTCLGNRKYDEDWAECIGDEDSVYVSPETVSEPEPEPSSTSEPQAEPEPSSAEPQAEPSSTAEPKAEPEPSSAEPEPSSTAEPKSEPEPSSAEPQAEPEPSSTAEPKAEPEPTSAEPQAEPSSTAEPKAEPEPTSAEPQAEPEPSSTAEPKSEPEPSSAEPQAEPEPSSTAEPKAEPEPSSAEPQAEPEPSSTAEPKAEPEPSSAEPQAEPSGTTEANLYKEIEAEKKQLVKQFKLLDEQENATSNKPVMEILDDTPRPTESFFIASTTPRMENEVNIFDMNSTTQASTLNLTTSIYSTSAPMIHLKEEQSENGSESHDMSPFLPESEKTDHKTYSVTENVSEGDGVPHDDQSPFLPEQENKHILSGSHGTAVVVSEETEEANKHNATDSAIIKVIPIVSTTVAVENVTLSTSTTTNAPIKSEDDDEEKEEGEDDENLFGEEVKDGKKEKKEEEQEMVPSSTEVTIVKMENETTSAAPQESHIEILTNHHLHQQHHHTATPEVNETSTIAIVPISEVTTTSSVLENTESTPEIKILSTEEQTTFSTTPAPSETRTTATTLTDQTKLINENLEDKKDLSEVDNSLLAVVPLSRTPQTTTEQPNLLTSENEITEKAETTNHFLDQTTLPSNIKQSVEEDESSLNRNGKVISDDYYSKTENKLEKNEGTKLFKPDFLESMPTCPDDKFKCVYSLECVSKFKVCDGKAQCADYSDEWNCYNLTTSNILEFKREDKMMKICASKWTNTLSDRACNKMGYAGAIEWKSNKEVKEEKYLIIKDKNLDDFEFSENCDDGAVELQCSDFACGSNSTSSRDIGEFSSISLVVNKESNRRCTANIISPLWAVTSASCVGKPDEDWVLIAGNTELNMSKISKESVISLVSDIVTYPGNDFALLQLKQVLSFGDLVYATCLSMKPFKDNNECLTTGWLTRDDNSLNKYAKIMEAHANCTAIQPNEVCVMPKNKPIDECYNDKGSSLYCYSQNEKRWLLNGIQNQENPCRNEPEPFKFSSLTNDVINWIKNTVGNTRMFI